MYKISYDVGHLSVENSDLHLDKIIVEREQDSCESGWWIWASFSSFPQELTNLVDQFLSNRTPHSWLLHASD